MSEAQGLIPAQAQDPTAAAGPGAAAGPAALSAQIGLVTQRQEELAQAVQRLGTSVSDFDQLRAYVEQIGSILADLAKEVAAQDAMTVQRRLDDLAETVSEVDTLRAEVAAVAEAAGTTAPERGPAFWWPDLARADGRAEALESLATWVDEVLRTRHPEMYNQLGACWYLHPDILDELTALQAAWQAAYRDPAAPATAAIEWHDRWLPGAMRRCRAAIRARGCKGRHEKETPATEPFMDRQEFRNFIRLGPEPAVPVSDATAPASVPTPPWEPAPEPLLWPEADETAPPPE